MSQTKQLKMMATAAVNSDLKDKMLEVTLHLVESFKKHQYDMFVLEPEESHTRVRLAGYHFRTNVLDEETIIDEIPVSLPTVIWFKVDDYGDSFVGTLLYPSEY